MPTIHDDSGAQLSTVVGILGVGGGGTGSALSLTGGAGHVVRQSSVGGAFTVSALSFAEMANSPEEYIRATGNDQTAELAEALAEPSVRRVRIGPGTFVTTDTPRLNKNGAALLGSGKNITVLTLVPTVAGKAAAEFQSDNASVLYQCEIGDMTIYSPESTLRKDAIRAIDTSQLYIHDIEVTLWTGGASISPFTGKSSVGVQCSGREATYIERCYIYADIPIRISDNPNHTIDCDHWHGSDLVLGSITGDNPQLLIDSGVNLTNMLIDGDQAWVLGGYGLYYVDTATTFSSNSLKIGGSFRKEQATAQRHIIHIEHNQALYNLTINNGLWGSAAESHGIKLRKCPNAAVRDTRINGTGEALNVDSTVTPLTLDNLFTQAGATKSMGTLQLVHAHGNVTSNAPTRLFEYWQDPAAGTNLAAGRAAYFMGIIPWAKKGTLADTETTPIPSLGGGIVQGRVEITYRGATKFGAFSVYMDAAQVFIKDTTDTSRGVTETAIGSVAGRISVHYISAASILLRNRLGESVTYTMEIFQAEP